jgi:hypothetical protein
LGSCVAAAGGGAAGGVCATGSAQVSPVAAFGGHPMHACLADGCAYTTPAPYLLLQHYRQHTGERPYCCTFPGCTAAFASTSAQRKHARAHEKAPPAAGPPQAFGCTVAGCTATLATIAARKKHERVHDAPARLRCAEAGCNFLAWKTSDLVVHSRNAAHAALACPFPNCFQSFNNVSALHRHKNSPAHAGAGAQPLCKTCGQAFETVAAYNEHLQVHRLQNLAMSGRRQGAEQTIK